MDISRILYIRFFTLSLIGIICVGCPLKNCTSPDRSYTASHTIVNLKPMYSIGDTIWIRSELDCTTLQNDFTNTTDNYCDATFSFPLGCVQILDIKEKSFEGGIPKFEFISREGRVYNDRSIPSPDINNQAEYNKNNNLYQLEFGMVCNTIGMFYIGIKPGGGITKDHCDRAGLDNIIRNEDRDLSIYIDFRHPEVLTERDLRNIFCFEVQ